MQEERGAAWLTDLNDRAVNADIPNSSVRKSSMLKIIEVWEGRWAMLVR
jgi:hypothetical protein